MVYTWHFYIWSHHEIKNFKMSNCNNQTTQNQNQPPYPYPYPPYPYPPMQMPNNGQQQNPPYPYPPYPYPPPTPQGQQPPMYYYPPYPPQQQYYQNQSSGNSNNEKEPAKKPVFDWEKRKMGLPVDEEPQKPIVIDWNYKPDYEVDEPVKEIERNPSVEAICTNCSFDKTKLPELPDSFFKLFNSDAVALAKLQQRNKTFQRNQNKTVRNTARIKFQFGNSVISDLSVSGSFLIEEPTKALYDFLQNIIFNKGTEFFIRTLIPPKTIQSTLNQRLKDFKLIGNVIVQVQIKQYTGLKDDVNEQYTMQKKEIAERIKKINEEEKQNNE